MTRDAVAGETRARRATSASVTVAGWAVAPRRVAVDQVVIFPVPAPAVTMDLTEPGLSTVYP
jgi:hypothetical protein